MFTLIRLFFYLVCPINPTLFIDFSLVKNFAIFLIRLIFLDDVTFLVEYFCPDGTFRNARSIQSVNSNNCKSSIYNFKLLLYKKIYNSRFASKFVS